MKKIVGFLLVLGVSVFSNCTKIGNEDSSQKSKLLENREWLKNDMFSKIISAYANDEDFNMGKLEKLLKTQYNVDLWDEMNKLGLEVPAVITPAARTAGINVDLTVFFERSNITEDSKLYPYFLELTNSFTEESTSETIKSALTNIESRLEMDTNIPMKEKENFCAALLMVAANISSMEQAFENQTKGGRTSGWLGRLWRSARSVYVTTVLGAVISLPPAAATGNFAGFIVSIALAYGSSMYEALWNNNCYAAYHCRGDASQGGVGGAAWSQGWRQDCATGKCKPY